MGFAVLRHRRCGRGVQSKTLTPQYGRGTFCSMGNGIRTARIIALGIVILVVAYYVYDVLTPPDRLDKLANIIHLEDRRELSGRLKAYLEDPAPQVRSRAALAVGRIGGPGSAEPLMAMLTDSIWDVAATAALSVGFTGEKNYAFDLMSVAADLPPRIISKAIESVGRLADSSMTQTIEELAGYLVHPSPDIREKTVMALFRAGAKDKAAAVLAMLEDEPDTAVQRTCLYFLARFDISQAGEVYADFLADPDPFLRSLAVRGMGAVQNAEAERYLGIALNDGEPRVVAQAIAELAGYKSSSAGNLLARKLETEENEKLIAALIGALRRMNHAGAVALAPVKATQHPTRGIVGETVKYLATIRKGRAMDYIDSLLREEDAFIRASCAEALGLIRQTNVTPRLAHLFNDEDPMVRAAAFTTLMATDSATADFYITEALSDADFVVVSLAVDAVAELKASTYLPAVRTMISRKEGVDVDLRRTIVQATRPFLEGTAADSNAMQILVLGLNDENYIVRREASSIWDDLLKQPKPPVSLLAETRFSERQIRKALERYGTNPYATVVTSKGEFELELYFDVAPLTVMTFIGLADDDFYDGLTFHRVVPNFVVQGGDPRGDGWGGPDYYIRDEYSSEPYQRGTVGIATSGKDTGGSQFFVTLSPQPHLEGRYTVFGRVLYGMDIVDLIVAGDEIETVHIQEGQS